jgi:hypothetical protein
MFNQHPKQFYEDKAVAPGQCITGENKNQEINSDIHIRESYFP